MEQPEKPLPRNNRTRSHSAGDSQPIRSRKLLRWARVLIRSVLVLPLIAGGTLAICYSNLPWAWTRLALAVVFAGFAVWTLWLARRPRWRWSFFGVWSAVTIWWLCIPPSHDRPWRREVAVMPRAIIEGDRVRLTNLRAFTYRSKDDFDARYVDRDVSLAHLVSVDLLMSYWDDGPIAHTFVSFNFDDGSPPVCISIEARLEAGETFGSIPGMFKQFELIYVVGDERDLVRVRTDHRNEDVLLYRIRASPEAARRLFLAYLDRINHLADHPEWYHLLSNNCTLNIIRHSRDAGGRHSRFQPRYLLSGRIDRYVYELGILDTSVGFEELRRRAHISDAARAAGDADDFSARIRAASPVPGTE